MLLVTKKLSCQVVLWCSGWLTSTGQRFVPIVWFLPFYITEYGEPVPIFTKNAKILSFIMCWKVALGWWCREILPTSNNNCEQGWKFSTKVSSQKDISHKAALQPPEIERPHNNSYLSMKCGSVYGVSDQYMNWLSWWKCNVKRHEALHRPHTIHTCEMYMYVRDPAVWILNIFIFSIDIMWLENDMIIIVLDF